MIDDAVTNTRKVRSVTVPLCRPALRQRRSAGFALIERIVFVAAAAILFPAFAQAREKSRKATCLFNEKHRGMEFLQHNQEFDEMIPRKNRRSGNTGALDGAGQIYPCIKSNVRPTQEPVRPFMRRRFCRSARHRILCSTICSAKKTGSRTATGPPCS